MIFPKVGEGVEKFFISSFGMIVVPELSTPVSHIWFLKSLPSRIALAMDMKLKDLEKVLYFENFIIIEPGLTEFKKNQLITEEELLKAQEKYGEDQFSAGIGAEAIREVLAAIDLPAERERLREILKNTTSKVAEERTIKRLKLDVPGVASAIITSFLEAYNGQAAKRKN